MKKIYLLLSFAILSFAIKAQTAPVYLINEGFNTYDGTTGSIPAGWFISVNGTGSSATFYSSTGNFGPSGANSLKLRLDSMYVISPVFGQNADSVKFWIKGNGVDSLSTLEVFSGVDSSSMVPLDTLSFLNDIPSSGLFYSTTLPPTHRIVQLLYHKSAGNIAIDDFAVFYNGTVGIQKKSGKQFIDIDPNPSLDGKFKVRLSKNESNTKIMVLDVLGKTISSINTTEEIAAFDLSSLSSGIYFVRIDTGNQTIVRRVLVK